MFRGWHIWRIIITTCRTSTGSPFVDDAFTRDREGNEYISKAFLLMPWRKNKYGEHLSQRAFVIGWQRIL